MCLLWTAVLTTWSQTPSERDSMMWTGPLHWLERVHDFGAFSENDEQINCEFRFVNTSDEPVTILQAAASCGCTVPSYTTDPIQPGDTAAISVRFNPVGQAGRFEKAVYVRTNATHERVRLAVKGAVIAGETTVAKRYPVDMGPLKLRNGVAMVGKVTRGLGKSVYLDGYNSSRDSIRPTFSHVPDYLSIISTPEVVPPGELVSLSLYFQGEKCQEWGLITDSLQVAPNPGMESYTLPVAVFVEEDFSKLTPEQLAKAPQLQQSADRIDLGEVELNSTSPVTAEMTLTNLGKEPLIIRRAYTSDPGLTVGVVDETVKKGKSTQLTVTFDPSVQPTGIINAKLTLITNDPAEPTRTIRIVGTRK